MKAAFWIARRQFHGEPVEYCENVLGVPISTHDPRYASPCNIEGLPEMRRQIAEFNAAEGYDAYVIVNRDEEVRAYLAKNRTP